MGTRCQSDKHTLDGAEGLQWLRHFLAVSPVSVTTEETEHRRH